MLTAHSRTQRVPFMGPKVLGMDQYLFEVIHQLDSRNLVDKWRKEEGICCLSTHGYSFIFVNNAKFVPER